MNPVRSVLDFRLYKSTSEQPACFESPAVCYRWEYYCLSTESTILTLVKSFFTLKRLSKYDVVVTRDYFSSFGVNLRLLVTLCRTKHVTIGFNQSRKLLKTNLRAIDQIINRIIRRCDLIVVHARREMVLFSDLHCIPPSRFVFSLWGFDLPRITPAKFSRWRRPYVCLVGRNNRDIATFVEALDGMPIDGVIVTSNHQSIPNLLPRNIHVFRDLPQNDALDCIQHARANLILVKDNDRGAGHITAVAAMFTGTPQIFSDVDVIRDYLIDGVSAIGISLGDAFAVRAAVERVLANSTLALTLSGNAKSYAQRWLSNKAACSRVLFALDSLWQNVGLVAVDPKWLEAFELLCSRRVYYEEDKNDSAKPPRKSWIECNSAINQEI
jgi:hypothetical protein